jgi:hypothetical protein
LIKWSQFTVAKRKTQAGFVRRGMAAVDETKRSGSGIPADVVLDKLEAKLAAAKQLKAQYGG